MDLCVAIKVIALFQVIFPRENFILFAVRTLLQLIN